ncbi:MAG: peptidoglycan glycosyltransferase [Lachnospiraceae bacterium]|nr:peptidoglycan glycosyltransferase [Lachnospiraceae bacterium]
MGFVVKVSLTKRYKQKVLEQQTYTSSVIRSVRGSIFDRNYYTLAECTIEYNLILDPKFVDDSKKNDPMALEVTKLVLNKYFGIEEQKIDDALALGQNSQYRIMKQHVSESERRAFEQYCKELVDLNTGKSLSKSVVGIWFEESYKRVYPNGTTGSHIIGHCNSSLEGSYGLEAYYDDLLKGIDGRRYGYYDFDGMIYETSSKKQDGRSLISTMDLGIQYIVQTHSEKFLREKGADNLGVILLDPNSGEIYAMQSNYGYNPNDYGNLDYAYPKDLLLDLTDEQFLDLKFKMWRNFCVCDAYEPGSTFKPFTVAAALEEGLVDRTTRFLCDGSEVFPEYEIHCHNRNGHGDISLLDTISLSCNDGLMQIAALLGKNAFSSYQNHFLFGEKTGIDSFSEAKGSLISLGNLRATELASSSFGQSFTVSMIQLASAYASLVNGGYYYEPHLVKEIRSADGLVIQSFEPKILQRTVSEETANVIKEALRLTVVDGTARKADIDGYKIAGKTGTAEKLTTPEDDYLVSFIGSVPADDPKLIIYVVLDNIHVPELNGSAGTATELAVDILKDVLPAMGIKPDYDYLGKKNQETEDEIITFPVFSSR